MFDAPERLKKYCSRSAASGGRPRGLLVVLARLSEGACPLGPVTERKRSQNPKGPLLSFLHPHGYSFYENALKVKEKFARPKEAFCRDHAVGKDATARQILVQGEE